VTWEDVYGFTATGDHIAPLKWWPSSLYTILWLESLARHLELAGRMNSCMGSFGYHRTNHWNSGRHLHNNVSYWHATWRACQTCLTFFVFACLADQQVYHVTDAFKRRHVVPCDTSYPFPNLVISPLCQPPCWLYIYSLIPASLFYPLLLIFSSSQLCPCVASSCRSLGHSRMICGVRLRLLLGNLPTLVLSTAGTHLIKPTRRYAIRYVSSS